MPRTSPQSKRSLQSNYIAPIDGLRAIAVFAVVLYHLGVHWIPGGFLGVDLFFVISGYVITRLILDSIYRSGALDLKEFFLARVRRLYPALLFMMVGTTFIIALFAPEAIRRFLGDIPFVLTGTNNWHLVAQHRNYFETIGRPPLLQHTWSLGVEFQFYLVWPLILIFALTYFRKKNLAKVALLIAAISGIALFIFSLTVDASSATNKISHIYFGTDTHSIGLFLGSALAVSWVPQNLSSVISQRAQDFVDGIGVFGLIGLLATFLFIDESNPALYRIAFPLAGIFGCAIITSLVHPASRFAPLLSARWLIWIGERSYGIYLWHWVIFQITRPSVDLAGALWAINAARILIVLALADISLRWIEIPIRRGLFGNWIRGLKYRTPKVRVRAKLTIASTVAFLLLSSAGASWAAFYRVNHGAGVDAVKVTSQLRTTAPAKPGVPGLWVTGDSVILGIHAKLASHFPIALINARVGRQIDELITVVRQDVTQVPHSTVILDVGNNNHITEASLRILLDLLKSAPKVILVNTAVPRPWAADNDAIINRVIASYPKVELVDWAKISEGHPEFFAPDGVHLVDPGSSAYVSAILDHLPTQ
jgi:peptidoglycan/LPS O-acetylase OafA/YrhL